MHIFDRIGSGDGVQPIRSSLVPSNGDLLLSKVSKCKSLIPNADGELFSNDSILISRNSPSHTSDYKVK